MTRARTFMDAKAQSHTNAELNWWIFMRVSGVILIFLVLGHIYMTFIQVSESDATYHAVVAKLSNPAWKLYDWLILTLTMLHGMNGLRYVLEDYVRSNPTRSWIKMLAFALAGLIYALGTVGLFSI